MSVRNIATGFMNLWREHIGIADDRVEKLAKIRGEICLACPSVLKRGNPSEKNTDIRVACGECGCSVAAKIRVKTEKCPLNKW